MDIRELAGFEFCPSCGEGGIKQGNDASVACTSCGYVYYHSPLASAVGIIESGDRIVITRRANEPHKGMLALPGGFVKYRESLEDALVRELQEELCVNVRDLQYLISFGSTYLYREVQYFTTVAYFVVKGSDLSNARPNDDIDQFFLAHPEELDRAELAFKADISAIDTYCVVN